MREKVVNSTRLPLPRRLHSLLRKNVPEGIGKLTRRGGESIKRVGKGLREALQTEGQERNGFIFEISAAPVEKRGEAPCAREGRKTGAVYRMRGSKKLQGNAQLVIWGEDTPPVLCDALEKEGGGWSLEGVWRSLSKGLLNPVMIRDAMSPKAVEKRKYTRSGCPSGAGKRIQEDGQEDGWAHREKD